ncbi:MAG: helix-turn-helix domain-containing protein [Saccharofermentanales bacterium]
MTFSEKIQILRKQNGLSQEKLAEKLDVSRQAISKWESGQSVPEIDKIIAISELFKVSTDYLIKNMIIESTKIANETNENNKQIDNKFTIGLVLFGLGFISIILFWIVFIASKTNYFVERNGLDYQGFPAFLKTFGGLELLFYVCCILMIYGIFLLFQKQVVSIIQIHKKLRLSKIG